MLIFFCPGQGAQKPGFLRDWLDDPETAQLAREYSEILDIDLVEHGTVSSADTIRDTAIAQPLIVAAGLLSYHRLQRLTSIPDDIGFAGHSVGEITAAALDGVLTETEALGFVRERSRLMADAAAQNPTTMAAVVGGDRDEVLAAIEAKNLSPANFNSSRQVVAAGAVADVQALVDAPPAHARVIPLSVAGAFHTRYMRSAVAPLSVYAQGLHPTDPTHPLWSNRTGVPEPSGAAFLEAMVAQVASPVHWQQDLDDMRAADPTGLIEVLPGGTLVGLAKHELTGVPAVALRDAADLSAAAELITKNEANAQ